MAATPTTAATPATTEEGFLADRLAFWHRFTGFTTKTTASLIWFCAWLWWCAFAGFTFFHVLTLPILVAVFFAVL